MKKIILIASMAIVILAQAFVLIHFSVDRYDIVLNGDKFKFLVTNLDLTNARQKGYIGFELNKKIGGKGDYGIIHIDERGFAELQKVAVQVPSFGAYVKCSKDGYFYFPYEKYYLKKDIVDFEQRLILPKDYEAYIKVRIKEGKVELMDLIVNGKTIESYIE